MYVRSVKVKSSSGAVHEYVRVVAAVRDEGHVKQRIIANLGRRDTLEAILPQLQRFLKGEQGPPADPLSQDGSVQVLQAGIWGPMLVVRHLFDELDLWGILDRCRKRPRRIRQDDPDDDWVSRVAVLVANRLTSPTSEHGMAAWLESHYLCDRRGRRYVPVWKQHQRVKVDFTQLTRWYRTLDHLILNKNDIEVALYHRLRDLFDLHPKLVLFDLTSTYFEGQGPDLAKHGYSRDNQPRKVQVVVGVVMIAGWPIAHHVWAGNKRDPTTVMDVLRDLAKRFQFTHVVFVGDRGMVSEKNFPGLNKAKAEQAKTEELTPDQASESSPPASTADAKEPVQSLAELGLECGFLLGMVRRRNPEVETLLNRVQESAWVDCPVGINAQEKKPSPKTRVQEVSCDRPGVRVFVVDSEERRDYEQRMRTKSMERARQALEKVQRRVAAGKLKNAAKIGASVQRALDRHHGYRYYDWELKDGQLVISEHPVNLPREKQYEGKYLIQTDQLDLTPLDAVAQYKDLVDVERAFRTMKDPLSLRPVWHRCDHRVQAHIFVAALAFLLERLLERRLKDAGVTLSARDAWAALATISQVTFEVRGEQRTGVAPGGPRARQVLKALGITDERPPRPTGESTTM